MAKKSVSPEKKVLNEALAALLERLEKTEQFVLDQAPDVLKQMVKESVIDNTIDLAASSSMFIFSISVVIFSLCHEVLHNYESSGGYEHTDPTRYLFLAAIFSISSLVGFFCALDAAKRLIYVKNCPKLFLLRSIKKLVS